MFRIEFPKLLPHFQTPKTVSRPSTLSSQTCCGTRRTIEFFKRRKMFGIELPKVLPLFQTPLTVSRLSRPWDCPALLPLEVDVQLRFPKEGKCFELNFSLSTSESLIEFFKRRKLFESHSDIQSYFPAMKNLSQSDLEMSRWDSDLVPSARL